MEASVQKAGHAEANGTRFYYEGMGAGDPLVLVHAGPVDRGMWDDQLPALARHYRVIRYDRRGYGDTPAGAGGFSTAQDLHALLGAIGIERAILVGCSEGGAAALDLALDHPDLVRALVLVSAVPSGYAFEGEPPPKLLEFLAAYQQQDLERAAELATQIWLDGPLRALDQVDPGSRARVHDMIRRTLASRSMVVAGGESPERPAAGRLEEVGVPTLVVVGDRDDPSILRAGKILASRIPSARETVIPGAGHLVNVEKPEEFNRAVLAFLSRVG